jgi:hypothetical protein
MDNMLGMVVSLGVGLCLGFMISKMLQGKKPGEEVKVAETNWWEIRDALTGTQMQILQFIEAKRESSITTLQEKFSFIPDRELYYRLEQICLHGFVERERKDGEIYYKLNPAYSDTVEDDKTVMLSQ